MARYDDVLQHHIRPGGRWQWSVYALFICATSPFGLIYFHMFAALRPHHFCRPALLRANNWSLAEWANLTAPPTIPDRPGGQPFAGCRAYVLPPSVPVNASFEEAREAMDAELAKGNVTEERCSHGWEYFPDSVVYPDTTVQTFGLVCDRSGLTLASTTAFLLGFIAGAASFGEVGDRFGRRKTGMLALVLGFLSSILTASAPVFLLFVLGRFLTGMFIQGHAVVMYTLVMEISGPAARDVFSMLLSLSISVFYLLLYVLLAFFIPSWRWLYMAMSSPMLLVLLYFPLMPESPRWLLGQGRREEAVRVINRAIQVNCGAAGEKIEEDGVEETCSGQPASVALLFRGAAMRRVTVLMMFIWFYQGLSYYSASFYSVKLPGVNPYLAVSVPSLVKTAALVVQVVLARRLHRRPYMFGLQLSGGVCLILVAFLHLLPDSSAKNVAGVVLMSVLLGFIVASFSLCYVFASEVFPTQLRSRGIGFCSTMGRVGAALAPLVVDLDRVVGVRSLPMAVCGTVGIVSAVAGWFLPESKGRPLMETAEEVEMRAKACADQQEDDEDAGA